MDRIDKAYRWNDLARKRGAPPGALVFNEMLIAWREGNLREARIHFGALQRSFPYMLETINVARLPEPPERFEEFATYCCNSPACGPYMKEPCGTLSIAVNEQQRSEDTVLRELRIEIEQKKRLRRVYEQNKELEIEIEDDAPGR